MFFRSLKKIQATDLLLKIRTLGSLQIFTSSSSDLFKKNKKHASQILQRISIDSQHLTARATPPRNQQPTTSRNSQALGFKCEKAPSRIMASPTTSSSSFQVKSSTTFTVAVRDQGRIKFSPSWPLRRLKT